jgi:hypothetical protein
MHTHEKYIYECIYAKIYKKYKSNMTIILYEIYLINLCKTVYMYEKYTEI